MSSISKKMRSDKDPDAMPLENMKLAEEEIALLAQRLNGVTPEQAVIFTAIVFSDFPNFIQGPALASKLGVQIGELRFDYGPAIEDLCRRGYIDTDANMGMITVPKKTQDCLRFNKPLEPPRTTGLDAPGILSAIKRLLSGLENNHYTAEMVLDELNSLMENNRDNSVSRSILKYSENITPEEELVLLALVHRYYFDDSDITEWNDLENYLDEDELDALVSRYKQGQMGLQTGGLIECAGNGGLLTRDSFHIKDGIKGEIFSDAGGLKMKPVEITASWKIPASSIAPKELFYNVDETEAVERLHKIMAVEEFSRIRSTLKENSFHSGFTCLFYGDPGTGKTETAYQIARRSGRDLFRIDVSRVKSCWAGESEKNIKDVFDKYRECVQQSVRDGGRIPILLFNEADAILGVRSEGSGSSVDKMENAIQAILLQEMEDLDGILVATTNLTCNLDRAFERRFLYKIRFGRPAWEARAHIWRSMIPGLTEEQAGELSRDFDLSGGEIENIARKRFIDSLIFGKPPTIEHIRELCKEESIDDGSAAKRIGF